MAGQVFIGVSGWRYEPWRGNFYPAGLAQAKELHHASRQFNSIELNGSFYSLQRPSSYAQWAAQTPPGFVFAVKGGRYITHMLKLRNAQAALGNFFASGLFALGDKLGPILWQFPPNFGFHPEVFEPFLAALPRTTAAAAKVAQQRDQRLQGRELLEPLHRQRLRHAVEVRHASFVDPAFVKLCRDRNVAICLSENDNYPLIADITADFVYSRLLMGSDKIETGYEPKDLDAWAERFGEYSQGRVPGDLQPVDRTGPAEGPRDTFVFFIHEGKVRAPAAAQELIKRVSK